MSAKPGQLQFGSRMPGGEERSVEGCTDGTVYEVDGPLVGGREGEDRDGASERDVVVEVEVGVGLVISLLVFADVSVLVENDADEFGFVELPDHLV